MARSADMAHSFGDFARLAPISFTAARASSNVMVGHSFTNSTMASPVGDFGIGVSGLSKYCSIVSIMPPLSGQGEPCAAGECDCGRPTGYDRYRVLMREPNFGVSLEGPRSPVFPDRVQGDSTFRPPLMEIPESRAASKVMRLDLRWV